MNPQEFSGDGLLKALEKGELAIPVETGTSLVGMVKKSDQPGSLAFTPAGCDTWVDIPTSMIEKAIHVGERRCKEHSHAVVRITLKQPTSPEGQLLAKLLVASAPRGVPESALPSRTRLPRSRMAMQQRLGGPGGGLGFDCDEACQAVLRACLEHTPLSSEACVFIYSACFRTCGIFGGGGGVFGPILE
jgi:hypothetical protein